jgi:hypothetical protein
MAAKPLRGRLILYSTSSPLVQSSGNPWLISVGMSGVGHANRWAICFASAAMPHSDTASVHFRLRSVHWAGWSPGCAVAASVLFSDKPLLLLTAFRFTSHAMLECLFESLAIVVGTVYVADRFIRLATGLRRFSLSELLVALTAICLWLVVTLWQYGLTQRLHEYSEEYHVDPAYPPLVIGPWLLRIPLFLGLACLCYALVECGLWAVHKAIWWMTLNRQSNEN